jgi:hypothetical protein
MRRFGLRFAMTYFLFVFATRFAFWRDLWHGPALWVDAHLLHLPYPLLAEDGFGNNTAHGTVTFLLFITVAPLVALLWTFLDRNPVHDERLQAWLGILIRMSLAPTMIHYGMIKLVPTQMIAPPPPGVLLRPIGDLIPNHLLWWTVGASPTYESILGAAELTGGILLLLPRTVLLGALLTAGNMLVVFAMNMAYDIPVKLPSLVLFLSAALLIWPHTGRLANLFLRNRRVEPYDAPRLTARGVVDWAVHGTILLLGVWAIYGSVHIMQERKAKLYPPRPPLFGAWSVETFQVNGQPDDDPQRWQWLSVANIGGPRIQTASGAVRKDPLTTFAIRTPDADTAILDGTLNGQPAHIVLRRVPLTRHGFHWIAP